MTAAIEEAERKLYAALEGSDLDVLADILADDLEYVHHQGIAESKSAILIGVRTGLYAYDAISRTDGGINVYSDLAVATGTVEVVDSHRPEELAVLQQLLVWRYRDDRWQLTVRIAAPVRLAQPRTPHREEA